MKFGKVDRPDLIDLTLPKDHPNLSNTLASGVSKGQLKIFVGCAKWNRQELKNFYPRGTKEELPYYSSQFNSIELNATFYRIFPNEQYVTWYDTVPDTFKFFPKVVQNVSHLRRLNDMAYPALENFLMATAGFKDKLGTIFLQMHPNFGPKNWDRVVRLVDYWPKEFPLALEFRHTDWFNDVYVAKELYKLLEEKNIANVLVDTAGRRDIMHMHLTNNEAFIRFVGTNHISDYHRLEDWVNKLWHWHKMGLENIHFFIHQNMEMDSPLLAAFFIKRMNEKFKTSLKVPKSISSNSR